MYGLFVTDADGESRRIAGPFETWREAEDSMVDHQHLDDEVWVDRACPNHPEQPYSDCARCDDASWGD